MTRPPFEPPVHSEEEEDQVGLALRVLGLSVSLGVGLITMALLAVASLMAGKPASDTPLTEGAPFTLLVGGTMAGIAAASVATWTLLAPVRSVYRRGTLAMVSGFATAAAMLVAMPLNHAFGRSGLVGLVLGCGLLVLLQGWLLSHRRSR